MGSGIKDNFMGTVDANMGKGFHKHNLSQKDTSSGMTLKGTIWTFYDWFKHKSGKLILM